MNHTKINLICVFSNATYSPETIKRMRAMGDSYVYAKAQEGVCDCSADIYTVDDFFFDYNRHWGMTTCENNLAVGIEVDDSEVNQWLK